ncbi:hydroxysqualene dehydroxylase [Adhaeribacter rhizoryzae]|uniref:NAD(P)-binding protein n=1 Tax=Adhaeribacter rhizoryzae TaxID=2607907 RepID=A0A5M6D7J6_9BACT|nr:FAD-dependent oxidoreductase [Adhaeribacter rhizoryzae]KAA5541175.1 NAD(P)-binding protein [Adhaeribacter rhizoryzae]
MKTKVAILGGGVAGMSAAHELAERGFSVEVYEKQPRYVGGKARSVDAENTGRDGRPDLPGEHGFRFFPGFYKHVTDTMKRIPFNNNLNGVFDNLVMTERVMLARFGKMPISDIVNFPKSKADLNALIQVLQHADFGLTKENEVLFADKIWQLLTSSYERRQQVYERIGWWQYMETDQQCGDQNPCPYEEYCVGGLTHSLVAAQPKLMSTKTGGDILLQLMLLMANPEGQTDRVLNGPTNDVWLLPWLKHLQSMGVQYFHHHITHEFICDAHTNKITGVRVKDLETETLKTIQADYYIAAMPLERMAPLVNKEMLTADSTLAFLKDLSQKHEHSLNWMNGIQYYLNQDVPLNKGHIIFIDSPWAVTAISQVQFWKGFDLSKYGNGQVKGILSVDVSDWFTPGLNGKTARDCTLEEIKDEVWAQMEKSLNVNGQRLIDRSMVLDCHIDCDISEEARAVGNSFAAMHNAEPLLVNTANSWSMRPEATTGIKNLFLASDYVRTFTDLATMEGANEAARRAVNGIIAQTKANVPYCKIWNLHEPGVLAVLRWLDKKRYEKGLPWTDETPWLFKLLHEANYLYHKLTGFK